MWIPYFVYYLMMNDKYNLSSVTFSKVILTVPFLILLYYYYSENKNILTNESLKKRNWFILRILTLPILFLLYIVVQTIV